ncbi:tRNA (guanine-N(7)-)-methyltransferase [Dissostichus eleginoides]|uniref:tRNA (Guanine-N(7)-)-methyltransferase n=1 Tax=Dissostichus eleginoides TaxID=100907 RepID=A0AAD9C940_DISEL|nr:tRNA (guanine-N(7)-)-methyltransferase [Dissostichus eleginoides]
MAAWCWAVTTVKRRNEGSASMSCRLRQEIYLFLPPHPTPTSKMKDGQGHSTLVMATGAAPSQAYICSQSHLADRGSLTQSLRVPEEPADSSSCRPCCYRKSATGATGFL